MIKKNTFFILLISFLLSNISHTYIEMGLKLDLVGKRELLLFFDSYKTYGEDQNHCNAVNLALAVKKLAEQNPEKFFDFSYEDPSVYEAGQLLKTKVMLLEPHLDKSMSNEFLSLLRNPAKPFSFDAVAFKKPKELTTFLAGSLTRIVTVMATNKNIPHNLTIRSNDPRMEHYLSLIYSQRWLLQHEKNIMLKNLLLPSSLLKAKRKLFTPAKELNERQITQLNDLYKDFEVTQSEQLESFANFASIKHDSDIAVKELNKSIYALKNKVSLTTVYEFLKEKKEQIDVYSNGPIVDVLLTLFNEKHPDVMVTVLGNHLAKDLTRILNDAGVIENVEEITDPRTYLYNLQK